MTLWPAPLVPGFHPDPSVVLADGVYTLVTSTFEYLPGLPVHRSTDLVTWELVGHVISRPEQALLADVPTPGGVWAPTIRHRDGVYYCIVTVMMGSRGCVVFTAEDPAGPWSDGISIPAVTGIDPDLAWDDDGTAYVTFASYPHDLQQVTVDLATGQALEDVRAVWGGSGLYAPEGPHLYRRDGWWYLLAAEGGTDRGHAVTVARSRSPRGPFEGCPHNPVLSSRSTGHPVQNVGHADLVTTPNGGDAMVLLGVRPQGLAQAFSPMGRETFLADVTWTDGWPQGSAITEVTGASRESLVIDLSRALDREWVAVRGTPAEVATRTPDGLVLTGEGVGLEAMRPSFVGFRQRHTRVSFSAAVNIAAGVGGVALRLDGDHFLAVEADGTSITARATLARFERTWSGTVADGSLRLGLDLKPASPEFRDGMVGADTVTLWAESGGTRTVLTELDGRYWTYEVAKSFTGRVLGLYAVTGSVAFANVAYEGSDHAV